LNAKIVPAAKAARQRDRICAAVNFHGLMEFSMSCPAREKRRLARQKNFPARNRVLGLGLAPPGFFAGPDKPLYIQPGICGATSESQHRHRDAQINSRTERQNA
jgi:hypothetical protein